MGKLNVLTEFVKKHKKLIIVGAVVVATAGVGVSAANNMNQKKEEMLAMMNQTQTSMVERRTLVSSVSATGTVTSVESENVSVNLSGLEVKDVSVEVGDMVEAGQILCVLDSEKIEDELSDTRTSLGVTNEKTKLDVAAAERNLENAKKDYETAVDRGNKDLNSAYVDYADAVQEQNEAEKTWADAKKTTKDKKAEYDSKKKELDEIDKELDSMESSSAYARKFYVKRAELVSYAESNGVVLNNEVEKRLALGADFSKISVGTDADDDFYVVESTEELANKESDSKVEKEETQKNETDVETKKEESSNEESDVETKKEESSNEESGAEVKKEEPSNEESDTEADKKESSSEETNSEVKETSEEDETQDTEENGDNTTSNGEENETVATIAETQVNENNEESQEFDGVDSKEVEKKIEEYLSELRKLNDSYNRALKLEKDYSTLKQEVATLEAEHKAAEQEESVAEKAHEQAIATSESQLNAFEKQQRNVEDTAKSNHNAVLSKSDSLYTSQLNSKTSGDNERDKIKEYKEQLEDCTVKASISGVVTAVNVKSGDMYNGSTMITIEDISAYEVVTEIDEYDIGKIEKGQKVIIKTNATGEEELEGTVTKIAPRASVGGSEVTYKVTISIDTPNDMIRMDMTAKLSIILESKENILTVPYESVQADENGKYYVEVISKDSENDSQSQDKSEEGKMPQKPQDINTKRIYVEKGIESDYYIEIISNEISEGMEIVVPNTNGGGMNIQELMMNQGAMGGF